MTKLYTAQICREPDRVRQVRKLELRGRYGHNPREWVIPLPRHLLRKMQICEGDKFEVLELDTGDILLRHWVDPAGGCV